MNERAHLYTLPYSIYPVTHRHDQILNDLDYEEAAETLAYLHEKYNDKVPPFGGNGLGAFVFARTYSRVNSDGQMEDWNDVVYRCMTGWLATMFWHIRRTFPGSDGGVERTGRMLRCIDEAHDMYDGFFDMRWMPPGRGLWTGGTELLRRSATPGQNCSAVSTGNGDPLELVKRLGRIMDLLMCGCGVGSDLKASSHNNENAPTILNPWADGRATVKFIVPDTREGWVLSYQAAIAPFFLPDEPLRAFDYSEVRKEGVILKNMGGVSSGPGPLMDLIATAVRRLTDEVGTKLGVTLLADLINILGKCTSMGNIRRAAEIIVGPEDSLEFFQLKDWNLNPQRGGWAWASNNSPGITCPDWEPSEAYLCNVLERGEPGAIFLVNTQEWARAHEPNDADCAVCLYQPCAEMPQEDGETCNLAEVILDRNTADQLYLSARHAYMWCKAQTLLNHHDPAVDKVVKSVRRIGVGITGLVNWLNDQTIGLRMAAKTLDIMHVEVRELDRWWSDYMGCPESRRLCTSKPSGTVSLLPYTTPGVHDDEAPYIIRRVQVSSMSPLWRQAQGAGYPVEMRRLQNGELDPSTMVVSFPLDTGAQRRKAEIGMQEQLDRAAMVARSWSDNAVSVTINIPPHEQTIEHLRAAVMFARANLKTVSFLPMDTHGYVQAPLEEITEETYRELMRGITPPVVWRSQHETTDAGCDAGGCAVPQR